MQINNSLPPLFVGPVPDSQTREDYECACEKKKKARANQPADPFEALSVLLQTEQAAEQSTEKEAQVLLA